MKTPATKIMDFTNKPSQEILDLARPTPGYREIMEVWPALKIDWSNRDAAVARLREQTSIADELDELDPAVEEEYLKAPVRDGYQNSIRIFTSKGSSKPGPLIVLYHGGGCVIGSPTMVAEISRWLVKDFNATVLAPCYRLAPEHPFPMSINDAWDTFIWITEQPNTTFRADPSQGFIVGGISAGATMAITIAHLARDHAIAPKITGLYSACGSLRPRDINDLKPMYRDRYLSRSQKECIENPVFSPDMQKLVSECYAGDPASKLYAPLIWPSDQGHQNLCPRIYQQVCGRDPGRDEALIFDDILKKDTKTETRLDIYAGVPHCFWLALRHLPESNRWENETLEGFRWLLRR